NSNLKTIVGPKCNSLSVKDMHKYNFRPKDLLRKIIILYLNISSSLYETIVTDNLYFNINLFKTALKISTEKCILNDKEVAKFESLIGTLEQLGKKKKRDDIKYPDEFIDSLTCSVMDNPVRLLTSNVVIDRSTYDLIMIGDCIDPFSRKELDDTKIVDDVELKERILKFKKDNGIM
ncbi:E4 ubiquitin-protein ligase UFD2, partial [Dictyocoela roeselum]